MAARSPFPAVGSCALRVLCGSATGRLLFCPVCAFAQRVSALAAGSLFFGALCRSRSTLRPATVRQRRGQFLAGFDGNPLSPRPCLGNSARWRGADQGIPRACIDEAACAPGADRDFRQNPPENPYRMPRASLKGRLRATGGRIGGCSRPLGALVHCRSTAGRSDRVLPRVRGRAREREAPSARFRSQIPCAFACWR